MTIGAASGGTVSEPSRDLQPGATLPLHRVRARNLARESANRIHDDHVARRYGFSGGLVVGTTTYGYLTTPLTRAFGVAWLERGTARVRFLKPVYEGDELAIVARVVGRSGGPAAGEIALEVEARSAVGETVAGGVAGLAWGAEPVTPDPAAYPLAPLPTVGAPPEPGVLAGLGALGSPVLDLDGETLRRYAEEVGDGLPAYRGGGWPGAAPPGVAPAVAHPGLLLQQANRLLSANVRLGPWVHVASDVAHLGVASEGERLTTRGRVARLGERNGRHYVDLDALVVAEPDRAILHARHRAIYRLPEPPSD